MGERKRSLWSRFLRACFYPYPDTEVRVAWLVKPTGYHDDDEDDAVEESFGYYGLAVEQKPLPLEDLSDRLWSEFRSGWPLDEGVVKSSSGSFACFVASFIMGVWFLAGGLFLVNNGLWSPAIIKMAIALPVAGFAFMICGYVQHRSELSEERKEYLESLAGAFRQEGFLVDYANTRFGYHYARFRHINGSEFDHHRDRHLRLNAMGEYLVVLGLLTFTLCVVLMVFLGMTIIQSIDEDLDGYHGWELNSPAKAAEYSISWAPARLDGNLFELTYSNPDFGWAPVELSKNQRVALGVQDLLLSQAYAIGAYFAMLGFFISFCRMPHEWDRHREHTERERKKHCDKLRQFHVLSTFFSLLWAVFMFLYMFSLLGSKFCGPYFIELPYDLNTGIGTDAVVHEDIPVTCKAGILCMDVLGMSCVSFVCNLVWWLMEEEWGILSGDHDVRTNDEVLSLIGRLSLKV